MFKNSDGPKILSKQVFTSAMRVINEKIVNYPMHVTRGLWSQS